MSLSSGRAPFTLRDDNRNVACRCGAQQPDKLRARDDLRYSMKNLSFAVETPINIASWDHIAAMCRGVHLYRRDWNITKADHEEACNQIPTERGQRELEVVAVRAPPDGTRYGFMRRAMMFGAVPPRYTIICSRGF